jgi:hypothetical protein
MRRSTVVIGVVVGVTALVTGVGLAIAARSSDPGTTTAGAPGTAPPGTELADGVVVPQGATQVGSTFPDVVTDLDATPGWTAVLAVDGDAFDVWDDLATQLGDRGLRMPASGLACAWVAPEGEQPIALTGDGPPGGADALQCRAGAVASEPDTTGEVLDATVELRSDAAGAYAAVQVGSVALDAGEWGQTWFDAGDRVAADKPLPEAPDPSPADRSAVPAPDGPVDQPGPGEPFGTEVNCLEAGYGRLRVPPGAQARAVYGPSVVGRDYVAVLSVDDAEAALQDLAAQMAEGMPPENGPPPAPHRARLADGGEVWALDHSVAAGGGACGVLTSTDGTSLLILPSSD